MKARANEIVLTISRKEGVEIQNQILGLLEGGGIRLSTDLKDTALANLFDLLNGNFDRSTRGVTFT